MVTKSISQVKIGDNPTNLNPNSLLELESTDKGLLIPRLSLTQTTNAAPLTNHVSGMIAYNTAEQNDVVPGFYYNDGSKWVRLLTNGQISSPTVIGTSPTNTFAITGLGMGNLSTDEIITIDPITGVLKKVTLTSLINEEQMVQVATEGQTQFPSPFPITDIDKINVYRNGVRINATMVNATTIALESGVVCVAGDEIRIVQIN
jgi:hypothetical protein